MTERMVSGFLRDAGNTNRYHRDKQKVVFTPFSQGNVNKITIIYTYKCPINCGHCCLECGPTRDETLGFEVARKCITEASKGKCKNVVFSGGECLLFPDEIARLITVVTSLEMEAGIVTNAYWAATNKSTWNIIKLLTNAGIRSITISADSFHQDFIPLSNVLRVIKESQNHNIHVRVNMVAKGKYDDELKKIVKEIKKHTNINFSEINVHFANPVGRLNGCQSDYPYYSREQMSVCKNPFNFSVFPNGETYCCCSVLLSKFLKSKESNLLRLGNIKSRSLAEIIEIANMSPVLNALRIGGPDALLDIWGENDVVCESLLPFYHICDFCIAVNKALIERFPNLADHIHKCDAKDIRSQLQSSWDERVKLFPIP